MYFPAGNSVHWCLSRLICITCGSPTTCFMWCTVALELSILFASWHTLFVVNLSKSTHPSLMVFETNSSSCRKNQKMSLCSILAVSGGYLARLNCVCTVLYHSSTLVLPCQKLVRRSKWADTSFDWGLQNGKLQDTY